MNEYLINLALEEAQKASDEKEIPVGAVLFETKTGRLICSGHNKSEQKQNPIRHAEIEVLETAFRQLGKNLSGYSVFVTLEPCSLCASALSFAHVDRVYFGAYDPKTGGIEQGCCVFNQPTTHHKPEIYGGIAEKRCQALLQDFFQKLRLKEDSTHELIG